MAIFLDYVAISQIAGSNSLPFDVVHPVRLEAVTRALENCQTITIQQGAIAILRGLRRRIFVT